MRLTEIMANSQPTLNLHRRGVPLYVGAGGIATGSHYVVTVAAVELAAASPLSASILGFSVGAFVKYWLNYSIAFRSRAGHASAAMRFAGMLTVMWVFNAVLFTLLSRNMGLHYLVAQLTTTILLIAPGYLISRYWVFKSC